MTYPMTAAGRAVERSMQLERATMEGVRKGLRFGLSMRCAKGDHDCLLDGSGCLCICHDPKE